MPSVSQSRSKILKNAHERAKRYGGEQTIKAEFSNYNNKMIQQDQPKPTRPREMAATSGGFTEIRPGDNGDPVRQEGDQDGGGVTVRSRRGSVIIDVQHGNDGVTATLAHDAVTALIGGIGAALGGQDTPGPVGVRSTSGGITLNFEDGSEVVEVSFDPLSAANLIAELGLALQG